LALGLRKRARVCWEKLNKGLKGKITLISFSHIVGEKGINKRPFPFTKEISLHIKMVLNPQFFQTAIRNGSCNTSILLTPIVLVDMRFGNIVNSALRSFEIEVKNNSNHKLEHLLKLNDFGGNLQG